MTYLMLEDRPERTPEQIANYILPVELRPMYRKEDWIIVKSYDQFVEWILENGLPDVISFDHDLADEHYAFAGNYNIFRYETGYDAAKWLCNYCSENSKKLPECYVHSMNPAGADNIRNYLDNYKKSAMKQHIEVKETGIQCDNPDCDWKDPSVTLSSGSDLEKYLNMPCPKCGQNVLTEEDLKNHMTVLSAVKMINSLTQEELEELGEITGVAFGSEENGDNRYSMTVDTHKKISISDIKIVENEENTGDRTSPSSTGTGTTL